MRFSTKIALVTTSLGIVKLFAPGAMNRPCGFLFFTLS
jgi:hypothetical protein